MSTPHIWHLACLRVYPMSMCLPISTCLPYIHTSTLHPYVDSTSICLLHLHMSTLPPHVYQFPYLYTTSICIHHLYMSTQLHMPTPFIHVYSTIHIFTPPLRVYPGITYLIEFRTHGEFENENTFAFVPHSGCCTAERENCVSF